MQFFYKQPVLAGVPLRLPYAGLYFILVSAGAARQVDIQLEKSGETYNTMPGMTNGFAIETGFDAVTFSSPTDTIVSFFASSSPVRLGNQDGMQVSVPAGVVVNNTGANRVPVDVGGATINVTATNVGINNDMDHAVPVQPGTGAVFSALVTNTPAQAIPVTLHGSDDETPIPTTPYQAVAVTNGDPVAATDAAGVLIAVSATRRGLRIKNAGANPVAIGGVGITFSNAAVIIQAGETWNENEAPGAAWYAICGAGLASTLNIQTVA